MSNFKTHHKYKVYRDGEFIGLLPNVKSQYEETLQINTPGTAITITASTSPDDTESEFGNILSEASDILVSEAGEEILYQETTTSFGPGTIIDLKNEVVVYEYSENNPNGVVVFDGYISIIKGNYGGSEDLQITVLSYGSELDNFIIESGESLLIDQSSQSNGFGFGSIHSYDIQAVAQSFQVTSTTIISKIAIYMKCTSTPLNIQFSLNSGSDPNVGGTSLSSTTELISNTSYAWVEFTLPTPVTVTAGTYNWTLDSGEPAYGATQFTVGTAGSDVLAGGTFWTALDVSHSYVYSTVSDDAAFRVYATTGDTTAVYSSYDPSDILRSIIADQNARGGTMTYDGSSIDDTGDTVSYTFKVNTTLEGAKKVRELGPPDWFWFGDVATNLIHYHQKSSIADHTLILGRHISELNLEYTLENVKSVIYFSGGDTGGGVNLFKKYTNSGTIASYGVRLERISDNRVTLDSTADILADDVLSNNDSPAYRTTVTIPASKYNLRNFQLGDIVGFANFNNSNIDNLLLQIVQIKRNADTATLSLDTVPPRATRRVEDIRRNLDKLQTVNNPDAPE